MRAALEIGPGAGELSRFLESFPQATFFHTPTWLGSLEAALPRFRAAWLVVRRGAALAGAMPVVRVERGPFHILLSLPFGTYGDPLALDAEAERALLDTFREMARSPLCAEAAAHLFTLPSERLPTGLGATLEECSLVSLEGGFDAVWSRASSKRRQLARRGEEAGIVVRPLEREGEVRLFHDIYRSESAAWGGVHPYPLDLFLELFKRRESVVIWGAFLDGELLGGHIDFYHGSMAQAWQGGMTERSKSYETGALLLKGAMAEACRRGMSTFNLGSSGGNVGIRFFKESLGGRERRYPVCRMAKRWWRILRRR